jgi:hypothetical protein
MRLFQPVSGFSGVSVIEVSNRRFRERLEECRQAVLPFLISDYRYAFDVGEVFNV